MSTVNELEEGSELKLDYEKLTPISGVIPCAVQDAVTGEVILIAYVNEQALRHSTRTGLATFWSTSRNELWEKGKSSGETFRLVEIRVNCEQNSILYKVKPDRGSICHTKNRSGQPRNCFYRSLNFKTLKLENQDL